MLHGTRDGQKLRGFTAIAFEDLKNTGRPLDLIQTIRFDKIEDLFDHIAPWRNDTEFHGYIFRGHGQETYKLVPKALRLELSDWFWELSYGKPIDNQWQWVTWQIHAEYNLLRDFYRLADRMGLEVPLSPIIRQNLAAEYDLIRGIPNISLDQTWISPDLHETAALAQHYGVPTRLLDWTYDLHVALHFGFMNAIDKDGSLAIWALNKEHLSFLKSTVNQVDVEFITPHYASNPNLSAQQGLFSHWPIAVPSMSSMAKDLLAGGQAMLVDRRPLDELIREQLRAAPEQNIFMKFVLPCSEAASGCKILERLGYGVAKVFPGYDGVAKQILSRPHLRSVPTETRE